MEVPTTSPPPPPLLPKRIAPRPNITLEIPASNFGFNQRQPQTALSPKAYPNFNNMQPMTPIVQPDGTSPYYNPFMSLYQSKASEFMFKQFGDIKDFTMNTAKTGLSFGEKTAFWMYAKISTWSKKWFTHIFLAFVMFAYTAAGAAIFVALEGAREKEYLDDIVQKRRKFVEEVRLLSTKPMYEKAQDWDGAAIRLLGPFEEALYKSFKAGLDFSAKNKAWNFWNSMFYCGTVFTTIGYGHIAPSTTAGRIATIVYAIIGIPMFLIVLADFGKLFTRCIKFLWAFVRRLYYTGSCRKVRKTVHVQDVMKGFNMMVDAVRRPSQAVFDTEAGTDPPPLPPKQDTSKPNQLRVPSIIKNDDSSTVSEPQTPAPSVFEIDDEFNLPISVAVSILVAYIFCGAVVYNFWEPWGFFVSFYFVFISMSTIGFGDFVPEHPMYMMASIIYLIFGLALTSMCINVVQVKLSDSFRQASAKIGATIGMKVLEEDGSLVPVTPPSIEMPGVHGANKANDKENEDNSNEIDLTKPSKKDS